MTKIRISRHNHYKNWLAPSTLPNSPYPAEDALIQHSRANSPILFMPYPFAYTDSDRYHFYLTFLIEAVELFPLHMDLGFDSIWRAFEAICRDDLTSTLGKSVKQLTPIVAHDIAANPIYQPLLSDLFSAIPIQSCEYLIKRIYSDWPPDSNDEKNSTLIMKRVAFGPGNPAKAQYPDIVDFLKEIALKYGAPSLTPDASRRASTLLKKGLAGEALKVGSKTFKLGLAERTMFIIGALLYTFRNDRFHANVQPPFKSSDGTLQTFAHVHYCFITAHMLVLFGLMEAGLVKTNHAAACINTNENLISFKSFYGRHLVK